MRDETWKKAAMLGGLLLLAGCGGGSDGNNAAAGPPALERNNLSLAEATDLVGQRYPLREGIWEATGGVTRLDVPDLPGDARPTRDLLQMIRARVATRGQLQGRACLRQQDARTAMASLPGMDPS